MWEENLGRGEMAVVMLSSGRVELQRFGDEGVTPAVIGLPIRTWHGLAALIESLTGSHATRPAAQPLRLSFGDVQLSIEHAGSVVLEYDGQVAWFTDATERWAFLHALELARQILADPTIAGCQIIIASPTRQTGQIVRIARREELRPETAPPPAKTKSQPPTPVSRADVELVHQLLEPTETLTAVLRALGDSQEQGSAGPGGHVGR